MSDDYSDAEARWRAVCARDARADGHFVFAVRSTGVYCRPACPARRARRDNVVFLDDAAAARAAGFRACLRCRPDAPSAEARLRAAVAAACARIEAAETPPALTALAREAGLSASHFQRVFKRILGVSPRAYAAQLRLNRYNRDAARAASVTEAMLEAGFQSSSRFYEASAQHRALAPRSLRARGRGERIRYALAPTSLGWLGMAVTDKGVCLIELGDTPEALCALIEARLAEAQLVADDAGLAHWLAALCAFLDDPGRAPELPLDVRGTSFQRQVWEALRQIPPGQRASYGELAARLGRPGAARAVAGACAANRLALAIPCHRAVAADGGLAGYRWGMARKRELLAREERAARQGAHAPE